jgi:hypothetical protein
MFEPGSKILSIQEGIVLENYFPRRTSKIYFYPIIGLDID